LASRGVVRVGDDFAEEFPDADVASTEGYATLVRAGSALAGEIDRVVQASLGLNLQISNTLAVIEGADQPLTPSEISDRTLISSATMTSTLDRLERQGLVRRLPNPEDRRSVLVEVTEAGRGLCDRFLPGINALQIAVMSDLEPAERDQLLELLEKVLAGAARVADDDPIPLEGRRLRRTDPK
jgi:DNA-binding MarR family transcriptional regulator